VRAGVAGGRQAGAAVLAARAQAGPGRRPRSGRWAREQADGCSSQRRLGRWAAAAARRASGGSWRWPGVQATRAGDGSGGERLRQQQTPGDRGVNGGWSSGGSAQAQEAARPEPKRVESREARGRRDSEQSEQAAGYKHGVGSGERARKLSAWERRPE
jgi:hypothetical protein